jgi:hypothetical protein
MADFSTAASNAEDALIDAAEGLVEEYEIRTNGRRVKRGRVQDQVQAAVLLEGLAARRAGGLFRLAKPKNPR